MAGRSARRWVHTLYEQLDPRFGRFLMVGLLNTAFGYLVFALLLFLGVHYAAAILIATLAGVLFNFVTTGRLVFDNRDSSRIFRFFGVYGLTYLLSVAGLWVAKRVGIDLYVAGAALTLALAVLSFLLHRSFVFRVPARHPRAGHRVGG